MTKMNPGSICLLNVTMLADAQNERAVIGYGDDWVLKVSRADLRPLDAPAPEPDQSARDMAAEIHHLRIAGQRVAPYLDWTISNESPGYHPTMPSAVAAFKKVFAPTAPGSAEKAPNVANAWQELCEMPGRTSPEGYPEYALITCAELSAYMRAPVCPFGHIMIGDRAVPRPLREVPTSARTKLYVVSLTAPGGYILTSWADADWQKEALENGFIHDTDGAARIHLQALKALSKSVGE